MKLSGLRTFPMVVVIWFKDSQQVRFALAFHCATRVLPTLPLHSLGLGFCCDGVMSSRVTQWKRVGPIAQRLWN